MNFFCILNFYFFWNHTFVTIAYLWKYRSYHPGRNIHDYWLFLVNENNCYRKVTRLSIVLFCFLFVFLFYISWATIMLQKWKTASLFKKKLSTTERCQLVLKLVKTISFWIFIIVLWSLKYDRDIKSNNQICFQLWLIHHSFPLSKSLLFHYF